MKLNIPKQKSPTATSTPGDPQQLKKLLSALTHSNMGELTKQIFQMLRDLNRQTMPCKNRLEDLEILRPLTHEIFKNLNKHFKNRTLPLSEKSQKIINLNQSILQELVYGYEIIADEVANEDETKVDDKMLGTAIYRAINYQSEILLHCYEVYQPCPKNLWHDTHQLYQFAESKNLVDDIIIDKEREFEKTTIANSYKQILLFTLAHPVSLRQSDSERIYKELFNWSQYASLQRKTPKSLKNGVFSIRVNEDTAPHHLNKNDLDENIIIRFLDASKLVSHVESLMAEQSKQQHKFTVDDVIPLQILSTLVSTWSENPKRHFSRIERQEHINVSIGLSNICKAIQDSSNNENSNNSGSDFFKKPAFSEEIAIDSRHAFFQTSDSSDKDPNFNLVPVPTHGTKSQQVDRTNVELGSTAGNNWDMVAKGHVLTETDDKDKQLTDEYYHQKLTQQQHNAPPASMKHLLHV